MLSRLVMTGLFLSGTACTSVRPVQPAAYFAEHAPEVVWVTYHNNATVPIGQPDLTGDTLRGVKQGTQQRVAIPLDRIRSVNARTPDKAKTAVLVTGALTGFVASVYVLWISKAGSVPGGIHCGFNEDGFPIASC